MDKTSGSFSNPLVSVVTPVYNGERYLAECIESVLAQTYRHWEYHIVNNCSTDSSVRIAQNYVKKDSRIRIHNNKEFLSPIRNFNHSLLQISTESKYCKIVHADDWLFPECMEEMVSLAEENPSIGIVSSYILEGNRIKGDGLPYPNSIFSGRDIARMTLMNRSPDGGGFYVFGSPTSLLIRSDLIRDRNPFYSDRYHLAADMDVCYRLLENADFGFVHKILSYSRLHDQSLTSAYSKINRSVLDELMLLEEYGNVFLSEEEMRKRLTQRLETYYAFLADSVFRRKDKYFWKFHKEGLEKLGQFSLVKLVKATLREIIYKLIRGVLNPRRAIIKIIVFLKRDKAPMEFRANS